MKKTGFTLAEVLITLSIIGVVAMLTLPALMTNVGEQQARTGVKKGINTLTEAAQMNEAINGVHYSRFNSATLTGEDDPSMVGLLRSRVKVDMSASTLSTTTTNGVTTTSVSMNNAGRTVLTGASDGTVDDGWAVIFFQDGTALAFQPADTVSTALEDVSGVGRGFLAYYDINGTKGPNRVSYCGASDGITTTGDDAGEHITDASFVSGEGEDAQFSFNNSQAACATQADRNINDQFAFFLTGTQAIPANAAAAWAYYN